MKDYYFFSDNESGLKFSEQLGLIKVSQSQNCVPLFKKEELILQLERFLYYLKQPSNKDEDGRRKAK